MIKKIKKNLFLDFTLPSSTHSTYRSVIIVIQIRSDIRLLFEEVGILRWKEKPEGEAKLKGSREANPAQD